MSCGCLLCQHVTSACGPPPPLGTGGCRTWARRRRSGAWPSSRAWRSARASSCSWTPSPPSTSAATPGLRCPGLPVAHAAHCARLLLPGRQGCPGKVAWQGPQLHCQARAGPTPGTRAQVYFVGSEAKVDMRPSSLWLKEKTAKWPWKTHLKARSALGLRRLKALPAAQNALVQPHASHVFWWQPCVRSLQAARLRLCPAITPPLPPPLSGRRLWPAAQRAV